jgi:Peptidase A4 family
MAMDVASQGRARARASLLGTAVLAAGVLFAVFAANVRASSSSCPASFDPYAVSQATLENCGITTIPLSSKTQRADGATEYRYSVDGTEAKFVLPPASFDAATATAAQLSEYGIPDEPPTSEPAAVTRWRQMVTHLNFVSPPSYLVQIPVTTTPPRATLLEEEQSFADESLFANDGATAGSFKSSIWSGYLDVASTQKYTEAQGYYTEPSNHGDACESESPAEVTWAGLGGRNSEQLAQDGTGLGLEAHGLAAHQAWWEILPTVTSIVPINLYATPGKEFLAQVIHLSGSEFEFFMYNYGTEKGIPPLYETDKGYDGSTAEYIVERPTIGTSPTKLLNFGSVPFEGYSNHSDIDDFTYNSATMVDGGGGVMAVPGALSEASFTDTFKYCK